MNALILADEYDEWFRINVMPGVIEILKEAGYKPYESPD